jgi:lysine-ketoglutarate reductase/saccharopine dehydrogenase-like protein (TIGR00300 family)
MILSKILDLIMDQQGDFEFLEFKIGKKKSDYSFTKIKINGRNKEHLDSILREVIRYGAVLPETPEVEYTPSPHNKVLPKNFYSTTNHPTWIYLHGHWLPVEDLMMDKQIIVEPEKPRAFCKSIIQVKKGDLVVTADKGIRIKHPERPREGVGVFEFMTSNVSPEKPSITLIKEIAGSLYSSAANDRKIVIVAGPAIIHTGSAPYLVTLNIHYMEHHWV